MNALQGPVFLHALTTDWLGLINDDPRSDKWVTERDNDTDWQQRICCPQRESLRGERVAASQASIKFLYSASACLRCSGHHGTFSPQCVQCHQATNHSTRAQYLCFLSNCVHITHMHVHRSQQRMTDWSVDIIIKWYMFHFKIEVIEWNKHALVRRPYIVKSRIKKWTWKETLWLIAADRHKPWKCFCSQKLIKMPELSKIRRKIHK